MDREKLCEALEIIKRVCEEADECRYCPLGNLDGCILAHPDITPDAWNISEPEDRTWKALKGVSLIC